MRCDCNDDYPSNFSTPVAAFLFMCQRYPLQTAEKKNNTLYQLAHSNGERGGTHHNPILNPQVDFASKHTSLDTPIQFP